MSSRVQDSLLEDQLTTGDTFDVDLLDDGPLPPALLEEDRTSLSNEFSVASTSGGGGGNGGGGKGSGAGSDDDDKMYAYDGGDGVGVHSSADGGGSLGDDDDGDLAVAALADDEDFEEDLGQLNSFLDSVIQRESAFVPRDAPDAPPSANAPRAPEPPRLSELLPELGRASADAHAPPPPNDELDDEADRSARSQLAAIVDELDKPRHCAAGARPRARNAKRRAKHGAVRCFKKSCTRRFGRCTTQGSTRSLRQLVCPFFFGLFLLFASYLGVRVCSICKFHKLAFEIIPA